MDKVRFGQVQELPSQRSYTNCLQIIINLLSNAIRFSQSSVAKTIDITVDVSRYPPTDESCRCPVGLPNDATMFATDEIITLYVYLSVRDSGPGLKPKDLEILVGEMTHTANLILTMNSSNGSRKAQIARRRLADQGSVFLFQGSIRHFSECIA